MLCLIGMDGKHAGSCFRLSAEPTARAHFAIGGIAFDVDDIFSVAVIGWDPVAARLALWTLDLLLLPINAELAFIKAVLIASLPTGIGSHSGATVASTLSVARIVSPTVSSRWRARMAPNTCVESVRCFPRALSHP